MIKPFFYNVNNYIVDKKFMFHFRVKYTFGPYFCCFYSIWSLFLFCVQLDPHFHQIVVNLVIFTNDV